jgi:hypothetical protein
MHQCDHRFCQVCKTYHTKERGCFIEPVNRRKSNGKNNNGNNNNNNNNNNVGGGTTNYRKRRHQSTFGVQSSENEEEEEEEEENNTDATYSSARVRTYKTAKKRHYRIMYVYIKKNFFLHYELFIYLNKHIKNCSLFYSSYDFECSQDVVIENGNAQHRVTFVGAHVFCTRCISTDRWMDTDLGKTPCQICGPNRFLSWSNFELPPHQLSTVDRHHCSEQPLETFIQWLLREQNPAYTTYAFAHNGGRYGMF